MSEGVGAPPAPAGMLTAMSRFIRLDASRPGYSERIILAAFLQVARLGTSLALSGARRVAWQELENIVVAFRCFKHAAVLLDLPPIPRIPLAEQIRRAESLGNYRSLWAIEGLGFLHAEGASAGGPVAEDLLIAGKTRALPCGSMVPLHAGMGLSISHRLLRPALAGSVHGELRGRLERFVDLCRCNSTLGCDGVALEALGMLVWGLYPSRALEIGEALEDIDPELAGYLWHGIGRGVYFSFPRALYPSRRGWQAQRQALGQAPHTLGRLNATAGFALPLVMVNIRQPTIIEAFLRWQGEELRHDLGFRHGVTAAALIWRSWAGEDAHLWGLRRHRPSSSQGSVAELWEKLIAEPCEEALRRCAGPIMQSRRFGELFRYQDPSTLVERLEQTAPATT